MGQVYVIRGRPVSGKSTWVREHARPGVDIVLDYDDLAQALGSNHTHGHADQYTALTQRVRGLAIHIALRIPRDHPDVDVYIVDSSPPARRMAAYRQAGAELVDIDTPAAECHRRADAVGRPPEWHTLIDTWAPQQEDAGWGWDSTPKPRRHARPAYRKAAHGRRYEAMRRHFLADKTHCDNCGQLFIRNAACQHKSCLRHGRGCHAHPRYPTVQHTVHLVDGGPSLDVSTWRAWCTGCNTRDGQAVGQRRRAHAQGEGRSLGLDW